MTNILEYKGYQASIEFSAEDGVLCGKIEGINDAIVFEGESVAEIEAAFHESLDDYIAFCAEVGKEPEKAYSGCFNVRISPELHRKSKNEARRRGESLNQIITNALEAYLSPQSVGSLEIVFQGTLPFPRENRSTADTKLRFPEYPSSTWPLTTN